MKKLNAKSLWNWLGKLLRQPEPKTKRHIPLMYGRYECIDTGEGIPVLILGRPNNVTVLVVLQARQRVPEPHVN